MEREVSYCTTEDGVRIAYAVEGHGPPLVVIPFFIESFSLEHLLPELQAFWQRLGQGRQLIRYDIRGTGLSQREVVDLSFTASLRDLDAVVRAAGLNRFSLWASSGGGPRAIAYAASHPENVQRLILFGTYARVMGVWAGEQIQGLAALARGNWPLAAQTLGDLARRAGDIDPGGVRLGAMFRESAAGEVFAGGLEQGYPGLDVTESLPAVRAATLVLHYRYDPIVPFASGQALAAQIPGAHFVPLEDTAHLFCFGDTEAVFAVVDAFLEEKEAARKRQRRDTTSGRILRTVLFTDIVSHTEMMGRLGDEKGREVLREHERITRRVLKQHGGAELKTMGDGFIAWFSSVTRAVECAIALQQALQGRNESANEPLHIRVGLNAGEPIEEEGDLFGASVILASRIAAAAAGGEILASLAVRELCAGKAFAFKDCGEFPAKGFEEPVRLFEVRWQD